MSKGLVVVVTGANGGVGFGICHRLLVQLSSPQPPDAQPFFDSREGGTYAHAARDFKDQYDFSPEQGLTLIMACRDPKRAGGARTQLLALLDKHISELPSGSGDMEYAKVFREHVRIEMEVLDLASVRSVLAFGRTVSQKYDYISHLISNAGTATYSHLDIPGFVYDLFTHFIFAIHHPTRNIQINGVLSKDNLGYAWQCNVFGHYVLYRAVQDKLVAYAHASGRSARVLWMSSLDAEPTFDPADDWQLTKTLHSYQASKFQTELVCAELEQRTLAAQRGSGARDLAELVAPAGEIHHFTVSPGVVATNMSALLNIWIPCYQYLMFAVFWLVRFVGSPHVLMSVYTAAISAVHLALVPLRAVPTPEDHPEARPADVAYPHWHTYGTLAPGARTAYFRFGSQNDRWGNARPGFTPVPVWEEHPRAGEVLLERFERLYQAFAIAEEGRAEEESRAAVVR